MRKNVKKEEPKRKAEKLQKGIKKKKRVKK